MTNQVPFSWERKPGASTFKLTNPPPISINHEEEEEEEITVMRLLIHPRPHDQDERVKYYTKIPLPPRAFQPPESASSPRKGLMMKKKQQLDDPFWAAYKKCTQSANGKAKSEAYHFDFDFSCKNGSDVCEDNFIRISQLPLRIRKERIHKLYP